MRIPRLALYILSGSISAILGWWVSLLLLFMFRMGGDLAFKPDFIILPITTLFFATAMVSTEIFLSNPTRFRNNTKIMKAYLIKILVAGIIAGIIAGILTFTLYQISTLSSSIVKILAWSIVGFSTICCENWIWQNQSLEGGVRDKAIKRLLFSCILGVLSGLCAAWLAEKLLSLQSLPEVFNEPISFLVFGALLGLFLNFATSPTFQVALRAGQGFEYILDEMEQHSKKKPRLTKNKRALRFVVEPLNDRNNPKEQGVIEEGLSIQLPRNQSITIGGSADDDIFLDGVSPTSATINVKFKQAEIACYNTSVEIHPCPRAIAGRQSLATYSLKHNQIITFKKQDDPKSLYQFVFYDRFLD